MFTDDPLVITPGSASTAHEDVMQYRISAYSGIAGPSLEWQDAVQESWRGEMQWCFTLPRGRMSVSVRAMSRSSGRASEPSAALDFLVKGSWIAGVSERA